MRLFTTLILFSVLAIQASHSAFSQENEVHSKLALIDSFFGQFDNKTIGWTKSPTIDRKIQIKGEIWRLKNGATRFVEVSPPMRQSKNRDAFFVQIEEKIYQENFQFLLARCAVTKDEVVGISVSAIEDFRSDSSRVAPNLWIILGVVWDGESFQRLNSNAFQENFTHKIVKNGDMVSEHRSGSKLRFRFNGAKYLKSIEFWYPRLKGASIRFEFDIDADSKECKGWKTISFDENGKAYERASVTTFDSISNVADSEEILQFEKIKVPNGQEVRLRGTNVRHEYFDGAFQKVDAKAK